MLAYLDDEAYRRRVLTQLNRGEERHRLARIDRMAAESARATALLDRLEQATLAKAFRGELLPAEFSMAAAEGT